MPVKVVTGPVVPHRRARVGVPDGDLHVTKVGSGVQTGRHEGVPEHVGCTAHGVSDDLPDPRHLRPARYRNPPLKTLAKELGLTVTPAVAARAPSAAPTRPSGADSNSYSGSAETDSGDDSRDLVQRSIHSPKRGSAYLQFDSVAIGERALDQVDNGLVGVGRLM
jgi:hypothetical protein